MESIILSDDETRTEIPVVEKLLWWQRMNLSFTSSGYGNKIPSSYMVKYAGRWRRIYHLIWGSGGSSYIIVGGKAKSVY